MVDWRGEGGNKSLIPSPKNAYQTGLTDLLSLIPSPKKRLSDWSYRLTKSNSQP
jgi:hypothetical protein